MTINGRSYSRSRARVVRDNFKKKAIVREIAIAIK